VKIPEELIAPEKDGFARDPLGYSALAWHKWAIAQNIAGIPVDVEKGPSADDLESPILWLAHAHALSQAASILLRGAPDLEPMPHIIRGVSHCQYHATALMLVGYSLEVCLKAMLILKRWIAVYQAEEKLYRHHKLEKLSEFVPGLSNKDKAVLRGLTHFVYWAGRYPDPGFGKQTHAQEVFTISEEHEISARDLFTLAARIMGHAKLVAGEARVE
jgi:hypothetical protein